LKWANKEEKLPILQDSLAWVIKRQFCRKNYFSSLKNHVKKCQKIPLVNKSGRFIFKAKK
jgi:hypothetical protein